MKRNYENLIKSIEHLKILNETFLDPKNYKNQKDYNLYLENSKKLSQVMSEIELDKQLYNQESRQMILADIIEYIFLSRGLYSIMEGTNSPEKKKENKKRFIRTILYFVNLLMIYESMTVDEKIRKEYLKNLAKTLPEIKTEELYNDLLRFDGKVGLPRDESESAGKLNRYFDKILPKTAGGLWHELLVYAFLLKKDLGYIIPLVLEQKFLSGSDILVPPDFLILTKEKNIYGIEVGIKKEIQSGGFSLKSNIPTATIDTINSRNSDRCPICHKWIQFCPKAIEDFSDLDKDKEYKVEIKCADGNCPYFKKEEIIAGKCPYAKYSRNEIRNIKHAYTNGLHYHYQCVLDSLSPKEKEDLIKAKDVTAIKTHYPYYAGLEALYK